MTARFALPDSRPPLDDALPPRPKKALITGVTGQDGSYLAEFELAMTPSATAACATSPSGCATCAPRT